MSRKKRKLDKIGRKGRRVTSAVAVCAISGMMFSGSANAANWILGGAGADLPYTTYYTTTVDSFNLGLSMGGAYSTITNSSGISSPPPQTGTTRSTTYTGNFFSALGSVNLDPDGMSVYGSGDNYTLGSGATVQAFTTGTAATGQYTPTTFHYASGYYGNGSGGWLSNLSSTTYSSDYSGPGIFLNGYSGLFFTYLDYSTTDWTGSIGTASAINPYAISTTGTVTLNGNNTIDGTATASQFNISGSDNYFNGAVNGVLNFTNAGTATITGGFDLAGNVLYNNNNATLILSNGSNVTGNITNTGINGILTFEGSSFVTGAVGSLGTINVGGNASRVQLNTVDGTTTVNNLAVNDDKAVVEVGGLLTATSVKMGGHYSKLELLDRAPSTLITTVGTPTTGAYTLATYQANGMKGSLDFGVASGTQGKGTLEVGDGVNVTFSKFPENGITVLNANNATLLFAGSSTVGGAGATTVGGDANGWTLGSAATSSDTFNRIWAGATGKTVTFRNDIYVGVDTATATKPGSLSDTLSGHTGDLNVGGGTVNLNGNLYGNLVIGSGDSNGPVSVEGSGAGGSAYTAYGDSAVGGTWENGGTVNFADGKKVIASGNATGTITTNADGTGTLNFMGGSNYSGAIGTNVAKLDAVTFNSASTGTATTGFTAAIGGNVYAATVTIGNAGSEVKLTALANITGLFDYTGASSMRGWTGGTVANIVPVVPAGEQRLGDALVLNNAHDAINFGLAHVTANTFTTHGGAMSFTVNSLDQTGVNGAASTQTGSSLLTLSGALTMTGAEKVQVNYVGSLANGASYTLINATSGSGWNTRTDTDAYSQVVDNSFSIDSSISQVSGDLIVTASRTGDGYAANENYIRKSATLGSFTNNAGLELGGIAAAGSQTGDMVQVIQKMDIDNFGYGNNQANLEKQVRRLAPIANASITQSALASFSLPLNAIDKRLSALRGECGVSEGNKAEGISHDSGTWLQGLGSYGRQEQHGEYDGYSSTLYGGALGIDGCVTENLLLGIAGGYGATTVEQKDFRNGDTMQIKNYQVMGYLNVKVTSALYLDGAVSYGLDKYDGHRAAAVGRTADANFDGRQFGADLGIGYGIKLGNKTTFTPMASVDYKQLKQDGYTETGAGAISLNVEEQSLNRTRLGVGARLATEWANPGFSFRPEVALHWYRDTGTLSKDTLSSFVGGGSSFVTPGVVVDPETWNLSAALTASSSSTFSLQFRYDLDKRTEFMAHTGSVTARWGF